MENLGGGMFEADDMIEAGLEGFDHLVGKNFYDVPKKAAKIPQKAQQGAYKLREKRPNLDNIHIPHRHRHQNQQQRQQDQGNPGPEPASARDQLHYDSGDISPTSTAPPSARRAEMSPGPRFRESWDEHPPRSSPLRHERDRPQTRPRPARRPTSEGPPLRRDSLREDRYADAYGLPLKSAAAAQPPYRHRGGALYRDDNRDRELDSPRSSHRHHARNRSMSQSRGPPPPRRRRSVGYSDRYDSEWDSAPPAPSDRGEKKDKTEKVKGGFNPSAWGAIAGGLVGSEVGRKTSPIVATVLGAGLGALGGKALQKRQKRHQRRDERIKGREDKDRDDHRG